MEKKSCSGDKFKINFSCITVGLAFGIGTRKFYVFDMLFHILTSGTTEGSRYTQPSRLVPFCSLGVSFLGTIDKHQYCHFLSMKWERSCD